jgi:hypothetical protein
LRCSNLGRELYLADGLELLPEFPAKLGIGESKHISEPSAFFPAPDLGAN